MSSESDTLYVICGRIGRRVDSGRRETAIDEAVRQSPSDLLGDTCMNRGETGFEESEASYCPLYMCCLRMNRCERQ